MRLCIQEVIGTHGTSTVRPIREDPDRDNIITHANAQGSLTWPSLDKELQANSDWCVCGDGCSFLGMGYLIVPFIGCEIVCTKMDSTGCGYVFMYVYRIIVIRKGY